MILQRTNKSLKSLKRMILWYRESITSVPLNGVCDKVVTSFEHSEHVCVKQSEKNLGFQYFYYWLQSQAKNDSFLQQYRYRMFYFLGENSLHGFVCNFSLSLYLNLFSTRNIQHNTFICKENEHNPPMPYKIREEEKIGLLEHIGSIATEYVKRMY